MTETQKCKQNNSFVYTRPGYEDKSLIYSSELENFLLNENLFSPAYLQMNRTFLNYLQVTGLPFTLETMSLYIEHKKLSKQYVSPSTVKLRKFHMKRICHQLILMHPDRWTLLEQFRLEAFFSNIRAGSIQSQAIPESKILTRDEINKLLKSVEPEWKLILLFLATTGVRVSELVTILTARCEETRKDVRITVIGKGGKQRVISCGLKLYREINRTFPSRYLLFCTKNGTAFHRSHIWRGCHRITKEVLGKPVGVHTFRHSFATQMIQNGIELKRVSEFLGHSGTSVTNDMYVHPEALSVNDMPEFEDGF